jgi:hypothetical protein
MTSPPLSGSARQLARAQGLARLSAVTVGIGVVSLLGSVAIAMTLPGSTAARAPEPVSNVAASQDVPVSRMVAVAWPQPLTTASPGGPAGPGVNTSGRSR